MPYVLQLRNAAVDSCALNMQGIVLPVATYCMDPAGNYCKWESCFLLAFTFAQHVYSLHTGGCVAMPKTHCIDTTDFYSLYIYNRKPFIRFKLNCNLQHTDYIVEIVTHNVHKFTAETQIVVWWDTNHSLATSMRHRPR